MTSIKLRYVDSYVDAGGTRRFYFRKGKGRRIALPGLPGSAEFMAAYQAALEDEGQAQPKLRGEAGTFDRLVQDYLQSTTFRRLAESSQRAYRPVIERWVRDDNIGHRRVDQMRRMHVERMLVKRVDTPGAANDLLKKIRILMNFAIANEWRKDDPTRGIKRFADGEFHTWTEDEIAQFKAHWPIGSKELTAFSLLLFTGQRLSDVVRMSWRDIEDDAINVAQQKTSTKLQIPLHQDLRAALDATPREHMVMLSTSFGRPFTSKGFGNWMADKIAEAGLPKRCVTHGLRKAAARRLAEAGCTSLQIMSITGHKSLTEVERYTKAAQQKILSKQAMKLSEGGS